MQCEKWLKVVSNLRVDRKGTIAPHKPLLLLVLAELAEQEKLTSTFLPLTGELVFRFLAYWTVVAERRPQRPDINLPFYHMRSDGCWTPLDLDGQPTLERRRAVAANLDETFLACLNDPDFRKEMRRLLIAKYFTDFAERTALYQLVGMPVPPDPIVREDARLYEAARERGREARFRLTVIPAYNYTCALTRYRLVTVDSGSIVEAAHIHQFADSRNNHPRNGIALCKNAHWMFDEGLWSLDDDHRVMVNRKRFDESGANELLLSLKVNTRIHLPADPSYWPDKTHLAWHRKHHGFEPV
ncbi:MAG TPA: HNH endonuclease [Pyrinomonadaceae bacterium]|nr:HNH endonuclease [Pyrinomonadaceae bacterium]